MTTHDASTVDGILRRVDLVEQLTDDERRRMLLRLSGADPDLFDALLERTRGERTDSAVTRQR